MRLYICLEFFGLDQHIQHISEDQQRDDEQERNHGVVGLNFLEPVDGFVEDGEAEQGR
jgi:hypothetical protein